MRILLIGIILFIAIPVFGFPFGWDRYLYVLSAAAIGYGIFFVFFNGESHYKYKIEKKQGKITEKKIQKEQKQEEKNKKIEEEKKKPIEKPEPISVLTEEDKQEISKSVRES